MTNLATLIEKDLNRMRRMLATALAEQWHKGQKYGEHDYFQYHILGVASSLILHGASHEAVIVGLLHDILEDTQIELAAIETTFGSTIASAVVAVNKRKGEKRDAYLLRCSKNPIALEVKMHDAMFNAAECFKDRDMKRYAYYMDTLKILGEANVPVVYS